jgi:3-hydroxyisobutyrate dehydrogenase-like beta-hydroxyacid dehydrogenase
VTTVVLLHPGEMGAAIGACLAGRGAKAVCALAGRSEATRLRAKSAGIDDLGTLRRALHGAEIVISVCPPHGALALAREVAARGFRGVYVDANAIAPATAREVGRVLEAAGATFVDGGIIGPPPVKPGTSRLYLAGGRARDVAALFAGSNLKAIALEGPAGAASALKACYAAWTKGGTALLAAVRALAEHEGIEAALLAEWQVSLPEAEKRSEVVTVQARKAWRWVGEMEEIAASFEAAGLPGGFGLAAAEVYRKLESFKDGAAPPALSAVTAAMRKGVRKAAKAGRRSGVPREDSEPARAKFKFGAAAVKRHAAKRLRSLKRD